MPRSEKKTQKQKRENTRNEAMVATRPIDHHNASTDDSPGNGSTKSKHRGTGTSTNMTAKQATSPMSFPMMLPLERASSRQGERKGFSATSTIGGVSHYTLGSLRLELSDVQLILQEIIPKHSTDHDLIHLSKTVCKRMISRLTMSISLLNDEEVGDDQDMMTLDMSSSASILGNTSVSTSTSTIGSKRSSARSSGGISHNSMMNMTNSSFYWVGGGGDDWSEDVVSVINAFIDSSDSCQISAAVLWLLHSTIGSIRMEHHDNESAIESFQRSLWILQKSSSSSSPSPSCCSTSASASSYSHHHPHEELGLTLHRLAIAYGRSGDITQASGLLEKALNNYNLGGTGRVGRSLLRGKNHNRQQLVVAATERLERYRRELQTVENFAGRQMPISAPLPLPPLPPPPPPPSRDSQSSPGFFRRHVIALKEWKNQQKEG